MIRLFDFHEKEKSQYHLPSISRMMYYIVIVGSGGTGGYAVQRITKIMSAFSNVNSFLLIADPDSIEDKNCAPRLY
ncbi:hypothetical protein [Paenibacillus sp. FSL K6-2859]|uniref:hypothetical protein n=1 Tax=Paenibacillus sp. FSL K6-2859 TaxID=2921482 RepID=UPI0030F670A2